MTFGKCIRMYLILHSHFLHRIPDYRCISIQCCLRPLLYIRNIRSSGTSHSHCTSILNSDHSQIHKADWCLPRNSFYITGCIWKRAGCSFPHRFFLNSRISVVDPLILFIFCTYFICDNCAWTLADTVN